MENNRAEELVGNILNWIYEHDDEFINCALNAMDITDEELDEYGCERPADENEVKKLKYLLNKRECCTLDREEECELDELLDKYGTPSY